MIVVGIFWVGCGSDKSVETAPGQFASGAGTSGEAAAGAGGSSGQAGSGAGRGAAGGSQPTAATTTGSGGGGGRSSAGSSGAAGRASDGAAGSTADGAAGAAAVGGADGAADGGAAGAAGAAAPAAGAGGSAPTQPAPGNECATLDECCSAISAADTQKACKDIVQSDQASGCLAAVATYCASMIPTPPTSPQVCVALRTCCATLAADGGQADCRAVADGQSASACQQANDRYCGSGTPTPPPSPAACVTLEACCTTLSDDNTKADCQGLVDAADATGCQLARSQYCTTGTPNPPVPQACTVLTGCCATISATLDRDLCNQLASDRNSAACEQAGTRFCTPSTPTPPTACATLSDCCATLTDTTAQAACDQLAQGIDGNACEQADALYCPPTPPTMPDACTRLMTCCSTVTPTTDQDFCDQLVGDAVASVCEQASTRFCTSMTPPPASDACTTLSACCANVDDDSDRADCDRLVRAGDATGCEQANPTYCTTTAPPPAPPAECTALETCCEALTDGATKTSCQALVDGANASACQNANAQYCTTSPTPPSSSACATLAPCCTALTNQGEQDSCNQIVQRDSANNCRVASNQYCH
jgi:hypothetical protein